MMSHALHRITISKIMLAGMKQEDIEAKNSEGDDSKASWNSSA
jgi:hypothetical protein